MARFSSTKELSPAGTVIPVGVSTSNSAKVEAAKDARILVDITALGAGAATLDIVVQISPDNVDFFPVKAFNQISATGKQTVLSLKEEEVGTFLLLEYTAVGGTFTLSAKVEKKQGV